MQAPAGKFDPVGEGGDGDGAGVLMG